jgi:hypothetical protein
MQRNAAEDARDILEIIDIAAPIVMRHIAAIGHNSKLVYDWWNAQCSVDGDNLAQRTWGDVRGEVAHAVVLLGAAGPSAETPGIDAGSDRAEAKHSERQSEGNKSKRRRGRKPDTDSRADKRVWEAWRTRSYKTYEQLGVEQRMTAKQVKQAIDRHRHRLRNKSKRGSSAPE